MIAELAGVSPQWSAVYLLAVVRLSAALVVIPLFGAQGVPAQTKIGLALLLGLIVLPFGAQPTGGVETGLLMFAARAGSEVLVGLAIGIATQMVFQSLEMAAAMVGYQIGFGLSQVFDPISGAQTDSLATFYRLVATLMFFSVGGHHLVIAGLIGTFEVVPAGQADLSLIAGERVAPFFIALFSVALRIALPVTGALLLTDLAMGLVARTVPQMNILVVGFPVKAGIGVLVLAATVPLMTTFMGNVFLDTLPAVGGFVEGR